MGIKRSQHRIHIEELVLKGTCAVGEGRLRDGLERALSQLIKTQGVANDERAVSNEIHAGKLELTPATGGEQVGRRLAQRLHTALRGGQ